MPTYQYACTACAERLEVVQKFTDDALTECPDCGGALRKVFSPVGVVFKGSGFYKTDSRSSSAAKPDAAKTDAAKTDAAKTAGSSSGAASSGESSAPAAPAPKPSSTGTETAAAS